MNLDSINGKRQTANGSFQAEVAPIENTPKHIKPGLSWLVVSDLDGTLLDHDDYSHSAALPALAALQSRQIPLILCSSKTRSEVAVLVRELDTRAPFIVENGAAICGMGEGGDLVLGRSREEILAVLAALRREQGFRFRGFNDLTVDEVAGITGLSRDAASLARQREYSEPLIWQDSDRRRQQFLQLLARHHLHAQQGGRFLTVSGDNDKGRAVNLLRSRWPAGIPPKVLALGDSFNDQPMLAAADIAVVIRSDHSDRIRIAPPTRVIHTRERGPAGWNSAILSLLEEFDHG